jgi:WD40 repeat protein
LIKGHNGEITDCAFSPFAPDLLASSSNDCTVKLWILNNDNIKEHITKCAVELKGHAHKVLSVNWHNICKNTLSTSSFDNTVKVWDVTNQVSKV